MNLQHYSLDELKIIILEPWEVTDNPYKLHAAYAIQCLFDILETEDDDEEMPDRYQNYWGTKILKNILDRLAIDIAQDFNDAAKNHKPIRIKGKNYSIRKVNAYDPSLLDKIFNFPREGNEYKIVPEGILNLGVYYWNPALDSFQETRENARRNRLYLRQIIKLAEDDVNDGWDKLSEMEVLIYCWALYFQRNQVNNFVEFKHNYQEYLKVGKEEIISCLNDEAALRGKPIGLHAFSYDKVKSWHERNNQISIADKIPEQEAEDYWYEVALKNTFKPIDH